MAITCGPGGSTVQEVFDAINTAESASAAAVLAVSELIQGEAKSLSIIMLGQSNAISRAPKVTTQYDVRLKTFNGGSQHYDYVTGNITNPTPEIQMSSLVAFSEFARSEESWGPGLASTITRSSYDEVLFYAAGIGARHYRELKLGTGVFGEMTVADRNFRDLALNTTVDRLFVLDHGEADADDSPPGGGGTEAIITQAAYLSIITDWRDTVLKYTDYMKGSTLPIPVLLISSMNLPGLSTQATDVGYKGVQNAQLQAGLTLTNTFMIGAKYQFEFETDQVHITGLGKRFYAEKAGLVYNKILMNGFWKPMYMTSATEDATNTITATFNVPDAGNLVLDTTTLTETSTSHTGSMYGFEVYEDGVQNPITNVTVSGNQATITTQNAISGTLKELRIAQLNTTGLATNENKNRSNVRSDAETTRSIHDNTVILYDWAVPQSIILT